MKTTISIIVFLTCIITYLPGQGIVDDIYFRPSDANKVLSTERIKAVKPNYKNGAREIIYIESNKPKSLIVDKDTIYLLSEINDSIALSDNIETTSDEEGYYLNEFRGGNSEYEYAERIRRFHNPKFTIHISDPQYTDIYFLDNHNWNVYVDGSYAWVTPTWTNRYWDNYFWSPYSYNSWAWRSSLYSPFSYYNSWNYGGYPWSYGHYGSYYGGWGGSYGGYYGGYYGGWGSPYYHNPYGYSHYPYWGSTVTTSPRNSNYSETTRRREYNSGSGMAAASVSTRISGGNYSQAVSRNTIITSERTGRTATSSGVATRSTNTGASGGVTSNNVPTRSTNNNIRATGIDTRTRTVNTSSTIVRDEKNAATIVRSGTSAPRTSSGSVINSNSRSTPATVVNTNNTTVRTGTGTSTIRSTVAPTRSSTSTTPTVSTPAVRSSTTTTYSSPATTTRSSSGSFSTGSSSSGSSAGSTRSSGGTTSGGRR